MHGCKYVLNGTEATLDGSPCLDLMYDQTLGWSYVRVVSVPDMHETSRFRHRSHYQDPNRKSATDKSRHTTPTTSEDDEKTNTTEDENISAGVTTTEYSHRTCQCNMLFNGKSLSEVFSYSD